ncbi:MAG: RES family NAD+ phosphorylase [Deltaproteobacteria bacterium]|nr:RES family NAD+ phosphorylase [Deltaproteobacteria bacterium]
MGRSRIRVSPGPHPKPRVEFFKHHLPIVDCTKEWFTLQPTKAHWPFFSRNQISRFDDPQRRYGTFYVGEDIFCCFVEVYGREAGTNIVTETELNSRDLFVVRPTEPIRLVNLSTGYGMKRVGVDNRLCTGDYEVAQHWSRAFYEHRQQPDGLRYRSRYDPSRVCAVVFDRARAKLEVKNLGKLIDNELLFDVLNYYEYGLIKY